MAKRAKESKYRKDPNPSEMGRTWTLGNKTEPQYEKLSLANVGVLDEVTIDNWFHIERMSGTHYWLGLGDLSFDLVQENGSVVPKPAQTVAFQRLALDTVIGLLRAKADEAKNSKDPATRELDPWNIEKNIKAITEVLRELSQGG